ncbi:MAG: polyprenyl diphosphate synthase [Candidatus Micrarchaeota archaeon]
MKPKSIAIIPDGNRRFAAKNRLAVRNAYSKGFEKVEQLLGWTEGTGIEEVGFWALSLENYSKRSTVELRALFSLISRYLDKAAREKTFQNKGISVKFFGKLALLPDALQEKMRALEEATAGGDRTLRVGVAYSGKEEILQAAKRFAVDFTGKDAGKATESDFEKYLYVQTAPDLIIRTGNVSRLSGFLPWQNAYSELYFCKKLWPEFEEKDFKAAIEFYENTERRFGQ